MVCLVLATLSTNGAMVIGCGPGKSGAKQTTAPQSFAEAISQAAGAQSHSEGDAAKPRSQSEYEAGYNAAPPPWQEDRNLADTDHVPLAEGMMVTTAVASELGDYESIKTVTSISPIGVQHYVSANIPHEPSPWYKDDPPFRRVHAVVAVRTEDLQHATAYVKDFMPGQDREYEGSTVISFSSDVLAKLKSGQETMVAVSRTDSERQSTGDGRPKRVEPPLSPVSGGFQRTTRQSA